MADDDDESEGNPFKAVGSRLGGWARRVGELVAETAGRPIVGEAIREPLAQARALRLQGDPAAALAKLRAIDPQHADDPFVQFEIGLTLIHDMLAGGRPLNPLAEARRELGDTLGRGASQLLAGGHALFDDRPQIALDELRRAGPDLGRLPEPIQTEARWLLHLLAALAHLPQGNEERALRELQKARARTPENIGPALRRLVQQRGVDLALAAGELFDAELWVREALHQDQNDAVAKEMLCRVLAARGDRIGAHALLETLDDSPALDATRIWVGLTVGLPPESDHLRVIAMRLLQTDAESPHMQRLWALSELMSTLGGELPEPELAGEIVGALARAAKVAPPFTRDRFLQEVAHTALRLDAFPKAAMQTIEDRLDKDDATAPEELRLVRASLRLRRGDDPGRDLTSTMPPRFRSDPDIGGPWGPDPRSPVRNPDLRASVLASHRSLVEAEACLAAKHVDLAQDLLVDALIEWPDNRRARALLGSVTLDLGGEAPRLEELLAASTKLLAAVPGRVLGVSLAGVEEALGQVIAARERLARPLTIAIMGEFSAGKSTFVNALLGEAVAPMGVLPTTTTINVFRRGTAGGARVHYRDGRIGMIAPNEVQTFLHSLDDTEAQRIRHVEIERRGERMGDAAVVDTPGLNALDEFHELVAREFLDEADAVVWVFSATRSGAATEVGMLAELRESGRQVLGVLNKVDTLDDGEQKELAEYLGNQLGEVLVDVVPLRGREALEWRTEGGKGKDPFAHVEKALDTHFLSKARELKRSLTARRLDEALAGARDDANDAIVALEQRAHEAASAAERERPSAGALLQAFADALEPGVLGADDVLTREGLGLGLLVTGKGVAKGPLDPLDDEYLGACLRDAMLAGLQRALADIARTDPAAGEVLDRMFVPWARGHLDGLLSGGFVAKTIAEHGPKIVEGEAAVRRAFRVGLRGVAAAWTSHARAFVHEVERARRRDDREAASAPRAEALRLRASLVATIDGLREALAALRREDPHR